MLWRSCSLNNRETEKFMKKRKKRAFSAFISSFFLTFVIVSCILGGIGLAAAAYENTLASGFGENRQAFSLTENGLRLFDFEIGR